MLITINYILAGVAGVEPTSEVLETTVLPLNYTPISCLADYLLSIVAGSEKSKIFQKIYFSKIRLNEKSCGI